ncbi:box C/D snoRNA protein 1-like [Sitodiplosis mosellana]|uniref:box C/D snoRNA protein 1-like n=1 Tax=Sitodiplosis mosellana TaxID=263140 RepID=UPI002444ECF1|nr:box C/D snoRNA protein 1-like [Sitodiplosis mosellana]XP_055326269.1 box C/D snoRNA protein 1-like [Sitodiplosis mosellana]
MPMFIENKVMSLKKSDKNNRELNKKEEIKMESQSITNPKGRLGKCEVCNSNPAKYTCPKCEVKTCQIECLRIHKKELDCDGIRDKTKYIPLKQLTEADLMNDYVFLESCSNYTSARRTDRIKRYTASDRSLPVPLMKLKKAAVERQIKLEFLLPNFDKHKSNKTYYDWASKVIYWCIEWRFINAHNKIIIDERCCESKLMTELIGKYFDNSDSISSLGCYRSKGLDQVILLLKAEGTRKSKKRFFTMDASKTLQENLKGKNIVEYPVFYVVFASDVHTYDIINSEDVMEETRKHKEHYFTTITKTQMKQYSRSQESVVDESSQTATNSREPVNFLFSNGTEFKDDNYDDDDD